MPEILKASEAFRCTEFPETLRLAYNRTETIAADAYGSFKDINLSSIASLLIQECGRWTDRYASDFLITWDSVRSMLEDECTPDKGPVEGLFLFGIRQDGVDHTSFLMSRIKRDIRPYQPAYADTHEYRRIYALYIYACHGHVECQLKNISNAFTTIAKEDMEEQNA